MTEETVFAAMIDANELALRIAEACLEIQRPPGAEARAALDQLRKIRPEAVDGFQRAALRAAEYLVERMNAAGAHAEMHEASLQ